MSKPIQDLKNSTTESALRSKTISEYYQEVQEAYLADNRPWVLGYSGGKDSTATLQLVWNAIAQLPPKQRQKTVYVISSDTFVETPIVVDHIEVNLQKINEAALKQGMPISASKVVPQLDDTFWVNLLGRGYPAPSTKFRWCTDRMKIRPANKFILDRVAEFGEVVMILGARKGESNTRDQVLKNLQIKGSRFRRHRSLTGAFVYSPIEDFSTEDVWNYLLQVKSPWGVNNQILVAMYRSAQQGECPLVVDTTTPSCGNSRFGCWVCTVVQQDSSMESMIDNGEDWMQPLLDLRDRLASHHDPAVKRKIRKYKRRNGRITRKPNGELIPGQYLLEERQKLLRQLLEAQQAIQRDGPDPNFKLISTEELVAIRAFWRSEEQDWEDSLLQIYREVVGEDLDIVVDDVANFSIRDKELLFSIADKHELPGECVAKLLDIEREMHGMSRRAGIFTRIERVFAEDWLSKQEVQELLSQTNDEGSR